MAVVAIHAPGLDDPVGVAVLAGPAHVVDDAVLALQAAGAHFRADLGHRLVPGDALPLARAPRPDALQRVEDALRVVGLVDGRRPLGAVAAAAAGMHRVALELLDLQRGFVDVGQQPAGALAVEADRRHQGVAAGDLLRPELAVVLHPVVPQRRRRVLAHAPVVVLHGGHLHRLRLQVGFSKARQCLPGDVGDAVRRWPNIAWWTELQHSCEEVGNAVVGHRGFSENEKW